MKRLLALPVWLALVLSLVAATPVRIVGPTAPVPPYTLVELQAEGDLTGAAVLWDISPDDVADLRELPGGKLLFVAPPGTYKVRCTIVRLKDGQTIADRQRFVITIGTPGPPPQPPPDPNDPLAMSVRAAWAQETDPQKVAQATQLTSLYRQMAAQLPGSSLTTVGDCMAAFKQAEAALGIGPGTLPKTRRVLADYLNAEIGTTAAAALDKARAAAAFARAANVVGGLH